MHGAWHGAWCWKYVTPLLEDEGHKVIVPDLPGHGDDKTPVADITMDTYSKRVCQLIDNQSEPVILIGHSMGGAIISQVAEYRPEKIKKLIYLAAFLLQNGENQFQYLQKDIESILLENLILAEDQSYSTVCVNAVKDIFYADCLESDIEFAKSRLCPQAVLPSIVPVVTTEEKFGSATRYYITCLQDKAVGPSIQKKMFEALPCKKVISMDTSHSPFFSASKELVNHLLSI